MAEVGSAPAQVRGVIECRAPDGTLKWSVEIVCAPEKQEKQHVDHTHDQHS